LWTGNNKVLTATWIQSPGDTVANVVLTHTGGELETTAYTLHDMSAVPTDPFLSWIEANYPGLSDKTPTGDPDGDGMTNQQEFAFGLDPTSGASVNPIAVALDKATGMFSYTRRATPASTGLAYTVLTSTDLQTWTPDAGATEGTPATVGEVETVPVTLSASLLSEPRLFVRVQAAPVPAP